jgi:hypothetical protein
MKIVIDGFAAMPGANQVCEQRRAWLLKEAQSQAAWLDQDRIAMSLTWNSVCAELTPPFAGLTFPANLVVEFGGQPPGNLSPDCPMACQGSTIFVYSQSINAATMKASTIGMTVEQLTLHELIHASGDWQNDTHVRMNWAGVGALFRALRNLPVNQQDSIHVCGG